MINQLHHIPTAGSLTKYNARNEDIRKMVLHIWWCLQNVVFLLLTISDMLTIITCLKREHLIILNLLTISFNKIVLNCKVHSFNILRNIFMIWLQSIVMTVMEIKKHFPAISKL